MRICLCACVRDGGEYEARAPPSVQCHNNIGKHLFKDGPNKQEEGRKCGGEAETFHVLMRSEVTVCVYRRHQRSSDDGPTSLTAGHVTLDWLVITLFHTERKLKVGVCNAP